MDIPDDTALLRSIEAFIERTGMAETRFGRDAVGEASLLNRLRKGRSLSLKVANRVVSFMAEHDAGCSDDGTPEQGGKIDDRSTCKQSEAA